MTARDAADPIEARTMQILIIQGGLGMPSRTATLAAGAARLLRSWWHPVNVFDLREHQLPWIDPSRWDAGPGVHPSVDRLVAWAQQAQAQVWATPVYHNSYSGALKCALDHLSSRQLRDTPVALCGDGGSTGSEQPLEHLRSIARSFHAIACPTALTARSEDLSRRDDGYTVVNPAIVQRTRQLCEELVRFGHLFARPDGGIQQAATA